METNEHVGCKVPEFKEYKEISVWNERTDNGKWHGGITILIKGTWGRFIGIEREDPNKSQKTMLA